MKYGLLIYFLISTTQLQAQMGSRINALGKSYVSLNDPWNGFNNPAGLTFNQFITALSYQHYLSVSEISTQSILLSLPFQRNNISLTAFKYGNRFYTDNNFNTAYARQFQNFSLGMSLSYRSIVIPTYFQSNQLAIQLGAFFPIHPQWLIGLSLNDLKIYSDPSSKNLLHPTYNGGITYIPNQQVLITSSLKIDNKQTQQFTIGLEYNIHPLLSLRIGAQSHPFQRFAGFGVKNRRWNLSNAISDNISLGLTNQIELSYAF